MENLSSQKTESLNPRIEDKNSFLSRQKAYGKNFPNKQKKFGKNFGTGFIKIGPRTINALKSLFTKKITPVAICKIAGFMLGAAGLLAGFATFAGAAPGEMFPGSAPLPLYGSKILYGFGLVFIMIFIISGFASMSAKATKKSRISSITLFMITYVLGIAFLPAATTMWIGAAAGVFLFAISILLLNEAIPKQGTRRNETSALAT